MIAGTIMRGTNIARCASIAAREFPQGRRGGESKSPQTFPKGKGRITPRAA